jgi:hypothetical protein
MQAAATMSTESLVADLLRGIVEAVADRPGETEARRFDRQQTAAFSVMGFRPRDAVEIMVSGQCVMFNHVLADGTRDLLRAEMEAIRLRIRPQLTAMGNTFLKHLAQLTRLQTRPADQIVRLTGEEGTGAEKPMNVKAGPVPARPIGRPAAATPRHHQGTPVLRPPAVATVDVVAKDPRIARLEATLPRFAPVPPTAPFLNPALMDLDPTKMAAAAATEAVRSVITPREPAK